MDVVEPVCKEEVDGEGCRPVLLSEEAEIVG